MLKAVGHDILRRVTIGIKADIRMDYIQRIQLSRWHRFAFHRIRLSLPVYKDWLPASSPSSEGEWCSPSLLGEKGWDEGQTAQADRRGKMNRRLQREHDAIQFARHQRATANEFAQAVWQMLRNRYCRDQKFRREYAVPPYTVDFVAMLNLIIEVDGEHHQTAEGRQHDHHRDQYLAEQGFHVVRIPGYEVSQNAAAVRGRIEQAIDDALSTGPLIPARLPPAS